MAERFPHIKEHEKKFLQEQEKREKENYNRAQDKIRELEQLKDQTPSWKEVEDMFSKVPAVTPVSSSEYDQMTSEFRSSMRNTRLVAHIAAGRPINYYQGSSALAQHWTRHNTHLDTPDRILGEYEGRYRRLDLFAVLDMKPEKPLKKNVWFF